MKYDLVIKHGHVVDPANGINKLADVGFSGGKIIEVGSDISLFEAKDWIDAEKLLVVPGVIDPHTHTVRPGSQGSAYKMLLRCGVTATMDMRGPVETFLKEMRDKGAGISAACCNAVFPEKDLPREKPDVGKIRDFIEERMTKGAFGIKIMGGHYPFSPEVTGSIFEECAKLRRYVAIHCGSTVTNSNISGLLEAVALAEGRPLHIAHVNAYCRGMVSDVLDELLQAMNALRDNPNIISESYLSVMNGTYCALDKEGNIESRTTRNCLRMGGYPDTAAGLGKAIEDGFCIIYSLAGGEMRLLQPMDGHAHWRAHPACQCTFPVNNAMSLIGCATARRKDGSFVVDALCSDGGANPRNVIFRSGLLLVKARYLTLDDLVRKASLYPARMLGLTGKGHLSPGADGDVAVFDPVTGDAVYVLTGGIVRMAKGVCADGPGTVITTVEGAAAVKKAGLAAIFPDFDQSAFWDRSVLTA